MICSLFPEENVQLAYFHPLLIFPETFRKMELDVYIPNWTVAFEFQVHPSYCTF